jgi:hypothetical protein
LRFLPRLQLIGLLALIGGTVWGWLRQTNGLGLPGPGPLALIGGGFVLIGLDALISGRWPRWLRMSGQVGVHQNVVRSGAHARSMGLTLLMMGAVLCGAALLEVSYPGGVQALADSQPLRAWLVGYIGLSIALMGVFQFFDRHGRQGLFGMLGRLFGLVWVALGLGAIALAYLSVTNPEIALVPAPLATWLNSQ